MKDRIFAIAHYADAGVLYLLIALSLMSLAIIVERFFRLQSLAKVSASQRHILEQTVRNQQVDRLNEVALDPQSLEGEALEQALRHIDKNGLKGLAETFDTYVQFQQPRLEKSLTFLATVGSNAPYIGLFGTVLGIMKSFYDLSQASDAGQQTVMAGISAALIATAAGLMVAIPNILAYNYFQKIVKSIIGGLYNCRDLTLAYAKLKGHQ